MYIIPVVIERASSKTTVQYEDDQGSKEFEGGVAVDVSIAIVVEGGCLFSNNKRCLTLSVSRQASRPKKEV